LIERGLSRSTELIRIKAWQSEEPLD